MVSGECRHVDTMASGWLTPQGQPAPVLGSPAIRFAPVLVYKLKKHLVLSVGSKDSDLMWRILVSILPRGRQVDGNVSPSVHRGGILWPPASLRSHHSGHRQ